MIIYCCLSWHVHISHGQTHMAYARLCKCYLLPISYYFKYHRYFLHIALSVRRPSCTLLWHANSRAEVSDCKRLTSYICDEKHLGSTRLPGTAGRPSERLILTPLNVQWKVKWLYRPLIIAQAELESQTSHEYRRALKWRMGGWFQKKKKKKKKDPLWVDISDWFATAASSSRRFVTLSSAVFSVRRLCNVCLTICSLSCPSRPVVKL